MESCEELVGFWLVPFRWLAGPAATFYRPERLYSSTVIYLQGQQQEKCNIDLPLHIFFFLKLAQ